MTSFQTISLADAKSKIDQGNVTVVDLRDPAAFADGHIPGAMALDGSNVEEFVKKMPRSQTILVCCYHGNSSKGAAAYLTDQGFTDVYSIDGGFEAWRQAYPL